MIFLGIETSCDETAAAVVEDGVQLLSSAVASQVDIHARYGGVVPEVASRQHLLAIMPVIGQAMQQAGVSWLSLGGVAVTVGPGLPGSLLVGLNVAKAVAWASGLPLVGVNHLEAHIYAQWLEETGPPPFPALCLVVSGGHTELALMRGHGIYLSLGRTRDDAAGEAFDKVARLLGLGYPGGPAIQKAARVGKGGVKLPRPWLRGSHDFSFSGLKSALVRLVEKEPAPAEELAHSFQEVVVEVLATKTAQAARETGARSILVAGGVAANQRLREQIASLSPVPVFIPSLALCTDNGAMVASCGYFRWQGGQRDGWDLDVKPGLRLG